MTWFPGVGAVGEGVGAGVGAMGVGALPPGLRVKLPPVGGGGFVKNAFVTNVRLSLALPKRTLSKLRICIFRLINQSHRMCVIVPD
jgi:hypothetical protein